MEAIVRHTQDGELAGLAKVVAVVSNKEDAAVLEIARKAGIETHVVTSRGKKRRTYDEELASVVRGTNPDLVVLAGFMRILSPVFISAFPGNIINIHPADTKKHQGLGGYDWAFENRLPETRITVHTVDEGLDSGPIVGQHVVDLAGAKTLHEVEQRGLKAEHRFYSQMLKKILVARNDPLGGQEAGS